MDSNAPYTAYVRSVALIALVGLVVALALKSSDVTRAPGGSLVVVGQVNEHPLRMERGWHTPVRRVSGEEPEELGSVSEHGLETLIVEPIVPLPRLPGVPVSAPAPPYPLSVPVEGVSPADLVDTFADPRGDTRRHLAIDILAPTGTPVLAAASGRIERLHHGAKGGIALYVVDENSEYIYYYAHLNGYALGISKGMRVERGSVIGYVGHTGNAHEDTPHLHFAIWLTRPGNNILRGRPVNPYLALSRVSNVDARHGSKTAD